MAGVKGKLVVKGNRSGRWFMLHTTKSDGSPLESREGFVNREEGAAKTSGTSSVAQSSDSTATRVSLPVAQLFSALGQAYPPPLLTPCPVPSYPPIQFPAFPLSRRCILRWTGTRQVPGTPCVTPQTAALSPVRASTLG